jgi:hypothetical protein
MKRSSLVLAFFAAVCLFIAASCSQKSTNDSSTASKPTPKRPAPDFTVSVEDIWKEMTPGAPNITAEDIQKAKDKYDGKQVAITGPLSYVYLREKSSDVKSTVKLEAGDYWKTGYFDEEEKESFVVLKKGQTITIQCLGRAEPNSFSLEHCFVVNSNVLK